MSAKKILEKEHPLMIRIEKYQHSWLKKEANKRKISIASLIRYYINYFIRRNGEKEES